MRWGWGYGSEEDVECARQCEEALDLRRVEKWDAERARDEAECETHKG